MVAKSAVTRTTSGAVAVGSVTHIEARETAAAAALVTVRKGSATGQIIAEIALAASGSAFRDFAVPVDCTGGAFVQLDVGAASVTVVGL